MCVFVSLHTYVLDVKPDVIRHTKALKFKKKNKKAACSFDFFFFTLKSTVPH